MDKSWPKRICRLCRPWILNKYSSSFCELENQIIQYKCCRAAAPSKDNCSIWSGLQKNNYKEGQYSHFRSLQHLGPPKQCLRLSIVQHPFPESSASLTIPKVSNINCENFEVPKVTILNYFCINHSVLKI